jgi:hypothetical protein
MAQPPLKCTRLLDYRFHLLPIGWLVLLTECSE